MKLIGTLFVLGTLGTVYGGVVPWSQSKEDEAINLFRQYCGDGSDKGTNPDGTRWYCKRPKEQTAPVTFLHAKTINLPSHQSKQIVFIQTPSKSYKHLVKVEGQAEFNHDTDIYVVPGVDSHYVDIQADIRTKEGEGKPRTLFLQNNPMEGKPTPYNPFVPPQEVVKTYFDPPREVPKNSYFVPPGEVYETEFEQPAGVSNPYLAPQGEEDNYPPPVASNQGYGRRIHRKKSRKGKSKKSVDVAEAPPAEASEEEAAAASSNTQRFAGFQDFQDFQF